MLHVDHQRIFLGIASIHSIYSHKNLLKNIALPAVVEDNF
jgi:hypothetical protein